MYIIVPHVTLPISKEGIIFSYGNSGKVLMGNIPLEILLTEGMLKKLYWVYET